MFFVPYDLEVSNQELSYTAKHSEQWRGEEGERRKVAVYDYIWEEETVSANNRYFSGFRGCFFSNFIMIVALGKGQFCMELW